ncbi:DUF2202 domain-containing protein [uncultured Maribacter sp.]|uniref:DUF2202 domain-containing protein n=1 Tax=uncultured Maribacter sp. TaxID=431308 RepID=UPI0030D832EE|tara:strand:+ start:601 stop:1236 length:636 start_codon:yes stop_codon:yes gene_type:complete
MKSLVKTRISLAVITLFTASWLMSCENDVTDISLDNQKNTAFSLEDQEALLFMLEEEKLARDTYIYLDELWGINQFANIQISEQSHLNAVADLLDSFDIDYAIQPEGEFANQEIQNLYDEFITDGTLSMTQALEVGATIEDLDIVDLQNYINATSNTAIISVFESLQCGSRNHLRSFVFALENTGNTYAPQFLTVEEYELIISNSNEQCGR